MCLMIVCPEKTSRKRVPTEFLKSVHRHNSDGYGFMYWDDDTKSVKVHRHLGNAEELRRAWRWHEANVKGEFAFHARMRTHGDIDIENTHPYPVDADDPDEATYWMMHNGVLRSGNATDVSKSDTWHYIRNIIRPVLAENGKMSQTVMRLIGDNIGNNRFALLQPGGRMLVFNAQQGHTWHGMWLSNTYAWDSTHFTADGKYAPVKHSRNVFDSLSMNGWFDSDEDARVWATGGWGKPGSERRARDPRAPDVSSDERAYLRIVDRIKRAKHSAFLQTVDKETIKRAMLYYGRAGVEDFFTMLNTISTIKLLQEWRTSFPLVRKPVTAQARLLERQVDVAGASVTGAATKATSIPPTDAKRTKPLAHKSLAALLATPCEAKTKAKTKTKTEAKTKTEDSKCS